MAAVAVAVLPALANYDALVTTVVVGSGAPADVVIPLARFGVTLLQYGVDIIQQSQTQPASSVRFAPSLRRSCSTG